MIQGAHYCLLKHRMKGKRVFHFYGLEVAVNQQLINISVLITKQNNNYSQTMRFHWMTGSIMEIANVRMIKIRYPSRRHFYCFLNQSF